MVVDFDSISTLHGLGATIVPLASGFMLAIYTNGSFSGNGTNTEQQTGLRYRESSSESAWPTTAGGTTIPSLSNAVQHPNDWGVASLSNSDIHLVRRNSATVFEHIRYSGHGGSWGSVDTLPSVGLTGTLYGGGVSMVSDGVSVWCFVIDTDPNNSIRYNVWKNDAVCTRRWCVYLL